MKSEKQLYQWDVNQYLIELQPEAQFVDYPMGNEVIRIETDGNHYSRGGNHHHRLPGATFCRHCPR